MLSPPFCFSKTKKIDLTYFVSVSIFLKTENVTDIVILQSSDLVTLIGSPDRFCAKLPKRLSKCKRNFVVFTVEIQTIVIFDCVLPIGHRHVCFLPEKVSLRRNSRRFCERESSSVTQRAILAIIKAAKPLFLAIVKAARPVFVAIIRAAKP